MERNNPLTSHDANKSATLEMRSRHCERIKEALYKELSLENIIYLDNNKEWKTERWLPITGYEGKYEISDLGRVKSFVKWQTQTIIKKQRLNRFGYLTLTLWKDRKAKHFMVHVLVAKHYIKNIHNKPQVNHIDSIKVNNTFLNLEWMTASENLKHGFQSGTHIRTKGEDHNLCKLTNEQVLEIFNSKTRLKDAAKKYGVCLQSIGHIKTGSTWSHITGKVYVQKLFKNGKKIT